MKNCRTLLSCFDLSLWGKNFSRKTKSTRSFFFKGLRMGGAIFFTCFGVLTIFGHHTHVFCAHTKSPNAELPGLVDRVARAVSDNDSARLETLLQNPGVLSLAGTQGDEWIIDACSRIHAPRILDLLLKAGVNINSRGQGGKTPLMLAVLTQQVAAVEALLKAGSQIDLQDDKGNTAVMYCVQKDKSYEVSFPMLELLLEHYPDVTLKNKDGQNASTIALAWATDTRNYRPARLIDEFKRQTSENRRAKIFLDHCCADFGASDQEWLEAFHKKARSDQKDGCLICQENYEKGSHLVYACKACKVKFMHKKCFDDYLSSQKAAAKPKLCCLNCQHEISRYPYSFELRAQCLRYRSAVGRLSSDFFAAFERMGEITYSFLRGAHLFLAHKIFRP